MFSTKELRNEGVFFGTIVQQGLERVERGAWPLQERETTRRRGNGLHGHEPSRQGVRPNWGAPPLAKKACAKNSSDAHTVEDFAATRATHIPSASSKSVQRTADSSKNETGISCGKHRFTAYMSRVKTKPEHWFTDALFSNKKNSFVDGLQRHHCDDSCPH